jgi:phosphoribosylformimino-5-aminoimidazole carboxamide ribotide isomerase
MCTFVKRRLQYQNYLQRKPLEVAKEFEAHGIEYLHLVDLDGAKSSQIVNYKILEQIATQTKFKIDFGGGLKLI